MGKHLRFPYPMASGISESEISVKLTPNDEVKGELEEKSAALALFIAESVSEEVFKALALHLIEMDNRHTTGGSASIIEYMEELKPLYDRYMEKNKKK